MANLNIDALLDAIGNAFSAVNQTASLAGNAIASANSTDNVVTLGSIVVLAIFVLALGYVWKIGGGQKIMNTVRKFSP